MSIKLSDLPGKKIHVHIQYIDIDRKTVMNENKFSGCVDKVDEMGGIVVQEDGPEKAMRVIPPSLDACVCDEEGVYAVNWMVYRTQENRSDGQHEWWEWTPRV